MQFQWAMHNYYSIVMRTITLHTIHVGALENYTQRNNITKLLTELSWAIEVVKITNVTIIFATISQHNTCFMMFLTLKHNKTIIHFQFCCKFWFHQQKNRKNRRL